MQEPGAEPQFGAFLRLPFLQVLRVLHFLFPLLVCGAPLEQFVLNLVHAFLNYVHFVCGRLCGAALMQYDFWNFAFAVHEPLSEFISYGLCVCCMEFTTIFSIFYIFMMLFITIFVLAVLHPLLEPLHDGQFSGVLLTSPWGRRAGSRCAVDQCLWSCQP